MKERWSDSEWVKKEIEKRAKKLDKLCKRELLKSVRTENGKKIITFQDGQVFKISGPVAEAWPVTEYAHKQKGLLF